MDDLEAGAALGLGEWCALLPFSPAFKQDTQVKPDIVRFGPEMEPIVRLLEETPRDKCVPVIFEQLRAGLTYRNFLAALYLAAIRAARYHGGGPHGYDHNAYLVHSVNQLALDLSVSERLLPAFYALDNFKLMQSKYPNLKQTVALTGTLPAAEKAAGELHAAMGEWEPERAERAIVALARSRGRPEVFESLWHYAGRDWGFIGHQAILVANFCRLLETIGWQHAEHVLRYVAAALAGWPKDRPDGPQNQPYATNWERVKKSVGRLPGDWAGSQANEGLTKDLVALIREGKAEEACDLAIRQLVSGKAQAGAVWDAAHLAAGEFAPGRQVLQKQAMERQRLACEHSHQCPALCLPSQRPERHEAPADAPGTCMGAPVPSGDDQKRSIYGACGIYKDLFGCAGGPHT